MVKFIIYQPLYQVIKVNMRKILIKLIEVCLRICLHREMAKEILVMGDILMQVIKDNFLRIYLKHLKIKHQIESIKQLKMQPMEFKYMFIRLKTG